jgi:D-alanyl-D-alanine carboxypeptidase
MSRTEGGLMKLVKFIALAAALLLAAPEAQAQTAPELNPQVVARLSDAEIARRVNAVIAQVIARPEAVGLSVAVARGDRMVIERGAGMADLEWNQPADARTVFRIGSLTKQFTAAAIMKLVEQGKIGLDDPLSKYVPEFDLQGHTVTIRQMLTHSSGIPNYTAQPGFFANKSPLALSEADVLKLVNGVPFDFAPGTKWNYSNTNYFLLGMIVEKVSGRTYADFMEQELFDPLGLRHTRYGWNGPIIAHRAQGYSYDVATGLRSNAAPIGMTIPGGAGGLVSTAGDLLRWQIALTTGRAVSPASFKAMTGSPVKIGQGDAAYGFGLMEDSIGGQHRIWHNGGINGFNSVLTWWPGLGLRTAVISNSEDLSSQAVEQLIVAALTSVKPLPPPRTKPWPGSETALRKSIAGIAQGEPAYADLAPPMADLIRKQLPALQPVFQKWGAARSIAFKGVTLDGADQYLVQFADGAALFALTLDAQGRIAGSVFHPVSRGSAY